MRTITIAQMILRIAVVLALILGIIFWVNPVLPQANPGIKGIHMLLGITVVLALWVIGLAQGFRKGGSFGLALGTFAIGLLVAIVGFWQDSWKDAGTNAQLIDGVHLLLGLLAAGFGEMVAGRAKRVARASANASASA